MHVEADVSPREPTPACPQYSRLYSRLPAHHGLPRHMSRRPSPPSRVICIGHLSGSLRRLAARPRGLVDVHLSHAQTVFKCIRVTLPHDSWCRRGNIGRTSRSRRPDTRRRPRRSPPVVLPSCPAASYFFHSLQLEGIPAGGIELTHWYTKSIPQEHQTPKHEGIRSNM
jgi:hypothetical protein